ncbi:hypothetical protein HCU40_01095 [Pseudanabaena biceps]|nr:hypothetical protein [Pseudanabaena biceps]
MNRHYHQYISQVLIVALSATIAIPALAQPRRGDADRLRSAQDQPIVPTNTNQFSPDPNLPSSNLKIQNINLEVESVQPVIPGNYNASPQKVNKSGNFSSDPLNAIPIFQETSRPRRGR